MLHIKRKSTIHPMLWDHRSPQSRAEGNIKILDSDAIHNVTETAPPQNLFFYVRVSEMCLKVLTHYLILYNTILLGTCREGY